MYEQKKLKLSLSVGALVRQQVTTKTDYLVVGDISNLPDWTIERKYGKADELAEMGEKVVKIREDEYLDMIQAARQSLL